MGHKEQDSFKTVYFYRLFVPLVVSLLVLFAIFVVITTPPGTPYTLQWAMKKNPFEVGLPPKVGGRFFYRR